MKISELQKSLKRLKQFVGEDVDVVIWNRALEFDEDIIDIKSSTDLRRNGEGNQVIRLVPSRDNNESINDVLKREKTNR